MCKDVIRGCLLALTMASLARAQGGPPIINSLGMKLVRIEPGEYVAGSPSNDLESERDEQPQHPVRITRPFYLGAFEVTQDQYERVTAENPSWFSAKGGGKKQVAGQDTRQLPVDMVSWEEAIEFCHELSARPDERRFGRVYRLPTEAEWEYACRAGTTTRFAFGPMLHTQQARIAGALSGPSYNQPAKVGGYPPNAWGLYDMHGNVWEWCADFYEFDYYRSAPPDDPRGPAEGTGHVIRGGDCRLPAEAARSANRDFTRASRRDLGNGLRVACDILPPVP